MSVGIYMGSGQKNKKGVEQEMGVVAQNFVFTVFFSTSCFNTILISSISIFPLFNFFTFPNVSLLNRFLFISFAKISFTLLLQRYCCPSVRLHRKWSGNTSSSFIDRNLKPKKTNPLSSSHS